MIGQSDQASNQYGFYAVPKAVEPKKKYRQTFEQNEQYDDQQDENQNLYETLDQEAENQKQLQRDYYVDEAPYPQFKPKERGLDYGVQIQREDLFDFDLEARPLIEILVGRSVVSAINELQQEKQRIQRQQSLDIYQKKRNAELMVTQRLEAKSKRKKQEVQRRVLQKQLFVKNKIEATKKLISRKKAKHCLLNMKSQLFQELQEDGFLREDTYQSLRIQYEGWIYEQIQQIINEQTVIANTTSRMINQKQKQIINEHQKHIEKQNKRRKDILNERERVRKQNQQRKMKKKRRKARLQLNNQRADQADKYQEYISQFEKVPKILKSSTLSNGLTKKSNNAETVHISGGLINFILQLLHSTDTNYSEQQIQLILDKILNQLGCKLVFQFPGANIQKIEQLRAKMEADPIAFMKNKDQEINPLIDDLTIDYNLTNRTKKSISDQMKKLWLKVLIKNYLNCLPAPKLQGEEVIDSYQATDLDKKRQQRKSKFQFIGQQQNLQQQIRQTSNVLRVRFEQIRPEKQVSAENQDEQKPVDLDQWIDIFDGEGWQHDLKNVEKQKQRDEQGPASYALPNCDNTFVVDQRNLYFLTNQLAKLLDVKPGQKLQEYIRQLNWLLKEDQIPIYDVEMQWQ